MVLIKAFVISWLCQTQLFLIFLLGEIIFKKIKREKKKQSIIKSGRKHLCWKEDGGCSQRSFLEKGRHKTQARGWNGLCSSRGQGRVRASVPHTQQNLIL